MSPRRLFGALAFAEAVTWTLLITALVLRAVMIFAGVEALQRFHWLIYVFGGFLVFTGIKLFLQRNKEESPEDSAMMRWLKKRANR